MMGIDYVVVTVNGASANQPPVANAGLTFQSTLPTNNATLNGSSSYGQWTEVFLPGTGLKISGPSQYTIGSTKRKLYVRFSNLAQGTYDFTINKVYGQCGAIRIQAISR
jgi:hypothetical protein